MKKQTYTPHASCRDISQAVEGVEGAAPSRTIWANQGTTEGLHLCWALEALGAGVEARRCTVMPET